MKHSKDPIPCDCCGKPADIEMTPDVTALTALGERLFEKYGKPPPARACAVCIGEFGSFIMQRAADVEDEL